ncbi:hypothetical protein [Sphaerisporangium fuscum]|uniref:hypothetical protein n=1 Tax=Sphaerisporangium fuscum TaxID=2835868 RepID=UPI001BDD09BC|nr:hypothetical protein [Sphaerisporangium fuscum]
MVEGPRVVLWGGPLDGMEVEAAEPEEHGAGAYMIVPGEVSRAVYEPADDDDPGVWVYRGLMG